MLFTFLISCTATAGREPSPPFPTFVWFLSELLWLLLEQILKKDQRRVEENDLKV